MSRRRLPPPVLLAGSIAVLALGVLLPTTASAVGWVPGPQFTVPTESTGGALAVAPDGSSTAAWSVGRWGTPPVLQVQHAGPDDRVSAPLTVGTGVSPAMATSAANATAVAWIGGNVPHTDGPVRVAVLEPGGGVARSATLSTMTGDQATFAQVVSVGLDTAGNTVAAWTRFNEDQSETSVRVGRLGVNGTVRSAVTLGRTVDDPVRGPVVATAADGTTWVGWVTPDGAAQIARLGTNGAVSVPATTVSGEGEWVTAIRLTASPGGAAAAWVVEDPDGAYDPSGYPRAEVAGVRLARTGALVGDPFRAASAVDVSAGWQDGFGPGFGLAVGPDGTLSLAWTRAASGSLNAVLSRFAPGQSSASAVRLSSSNGFGSLAPSLGAALDGSLLASWIRLDGLTSASVSGARVAADGSIVSGPTRVANVLLDEGFTPPRSYPLADGRGSGLIGVATSFPDAGVPWSFNTYRYDTGVPLNPGVPGPPGEPGAPGAPGAPGTPGETGAPGTPGAPGDTGAPGTPGQAGSAGRDGLGGVPGAAGAAGAAGPAGAHGPAGSTARPRSAALRVVQATRRARRVTVSGTITARASGVVLVDYARRHAGGTAHERRMVRVSGGRWKVTITLPRPRPGQRGPSVTRPGTVKVNYGGTPTVRRATATRRVTLAAASR